MPLYEYRCEQCGRLTERIQKFSDPELTVCPHCGGVLVRTLTAPAVHFSGGGWYKDLYSSAKPPAGNAGGEGAKGEGAKGEGTKSESSKAEGSGSSGDSGGGSSGSAASPAPAAAPASTSTASKE